MAAQRGARRVQAMEITAEPGVVVQTFHGSPGGWEQRYTPAEARRAAQSLTAAALAAMGKGPRA